MFLRFTALLIIALSVSMLAHADELRQVISREHPAIQGTGSGLAVGRDGSVYVYGGKDGAGYVLRLGRDGLQKFGMTTTYATTGVAAGADGIVATSNAHFAKSVSVYDRSGRELGKVDGFTGNDAVGWDGPGAIEAGTGGDFFALDQHAGRIVRVSSSGQIVRSYPIRADGEKELARLWTYGFRVSEKDEQFYFIVGNELICRGFDGVRRWSLRAQVIGDPWGGYSGGFDVDAAGRLYLNDGVDAKVRIFDAKGQPASELTLDMGDRAANPLRRISHLRVMGDDFIVRQKSETEIFQVYDRTSGKFRRAVSIEHERLMVEYPSPVWTAGKAMPLSIRFDAAGRNISPRLVACLRPLGTVKFAPLPVNDGKVIVPADRSGLFQLRVGSGLDGSNSEYQVQSVIEIRPENTLGSLSIFTPLNRRSFRCGEAIPFSVLCRSKDQPLPSVVEVRLLDEAGREHARQRIEFANEPGKAVSSRLDPELTARLTAGEYRLTTTLAGWTIAEQYLSLGCGASDSGRVAPQLESVSRSDAATGPFHRIRHGDYSLAYPTTTFFDTPEQIARHVSMTQRMGENLLVDRLGHGGSGALGELPDTIAYFRTLSELLDKQTHDSIVTPHFGSLMPSRPNRHSSSLRQNV